MTSLGSSLSSDTSRAGSAWTSRYSTGVRTSSNSTGLPRSRMASSSLGVIVATLTESSYDFSSWARQATPSGFEAGEAVLLSLAVGLQPHRLDFPSSVAVLQYSRFHTQLYSCLVIQSRQGGNDSRRIP